MEHWRKYDQTPGTVLDNTIAIGTYIAYTYNKSDTHYHIAKIIDITEDIVTIWHMYTRSTKIKTAIWKPLYVLPKSNQISVKKPKVLNAKNQKLTSKLTRLNLQNKIVVTNVGIRNQQITTGSINILNNTNLAHHVYRKTWKQENLTVFDLD